MAGKTAAILGTRLDAISHPALRSGNPRHHPAKDLRGTNQRQIPRGGREFNQNAFPHDLPRMVRAMVEQLVQSFG
jgi:hypothetical protein